MNVKRYLIKNNSLVKDQDKGDLVYYSEIMHIHQALIDNFNAYVEILLNRKENKNIPPSLKRYNLDENMNVIAYDQGDFVKFDEIKNLEQSISIYQNLYKIQESYL